MAPTTPDPTSSGGERRCVPCSSGRCHFCQTDTGVEVCTLDMLVGVAACQQCRAEPPPWLDLCETARLVDAHPVGGDGEPDDEEPGTPVCCQPAGCVEHRVALAGAWGRASLRASYATELLRMVVEARDDTTGVLPLSCVLPIENYLERDAQRGPDLETPAAGGGDAR